MRSRISPASRTTSKPATVAVPPVGVSSVHSIFTRVDLPAPFGPEEAVDLARGDREVDAATASLSPKVRRSPVASMAKVMQASLSR